MPCRMDNQKPYAYWIGGENYSISTRKKPISALRVYDWELVLMENITFLPSTTSTVNSNTHCAF